LAIFSRILPSPIGPIQLLATKYNITHLFFEKDILPIEEKQNNVIAEATKQLQEYFIGTLKKFDLSLAPSGTSFQKKVWLQLQSISFGTTTSYQKMALAMGDVLAIRAMATANGKNPIPIIIPCHRVIGSNGKLVGYSGGLDKKRWLLHHENAIPQQLF
jgi:methylated-DNA-[protein]-cysteine S-methyltransferase